MRLREVQEAMRALLRGEAGLDETAAALGVEPGRLAIYRDMVADHVRAVLAKDYGRVQRLVDGPTWDAWCRDYYRRHPPAHWELNQAGAAFADFLEGAGAEPFLVALARLEWEEFSTYVHPARIPARVEEVTLNPTVSVLASPWDLAAFLRAHRRATLSPKTPRPAPAAAPTTLLLFRSPTTSRVVRLAGDPETLFAFKVAADRLDPAAAAAASGLEPARVEALLARAGARGLILLPS
jgi:hypothetical protein